MMMIMIIKMCKYFLFFIFFSFTGDFCPLDIKTVTQSIVTIKMLCIFPLVKWQLLFLTEGIIRKHRISYINMPF